MRLLNTLLVSALLLVPVGSLAAPDSFVLSDQQDEAYYRFAVLAGEAVLVTGSARLEGALHANGTVDLQPGSLVEGDVSATGRLDVRGVVDGTVTEESPPVQLPALLDMEALRGLADRVLEGDVVLHDEVVDDVLFVDGTVRLRGSLAGPGTLVASGDVFLDTTANDAGSPVAETPLSLIAGGDVRIGPGRAFRGVVRAGRDVTLEKEVTFDGVMVADRRIHVKTDSRLSFVDFDQTPPTLTAVTPAPGAVLGTATTEIRVAYSDDFSGLRLSSVQLVVDGEDRTADAVVGPDAVVLPAGETFSDGAHQVEVTVEDHSDNPGRLSFTFVVDTVPPSLAVIRPNQPVVLNDDSPGIVVRYSDAASGVDATTLSISLDGAELSECQTGTTFAGCEPPSLGQGRHRVVASVQDRAGNTVTADRDFDILFDTRPPTILFTEPTDGARLGDPVITVAGTLSDPGGSGIAGATLQGNPLPVTDGAFTASVNLDEGPNTLTVEAVDLAGNLATAGLTVTFSSDLVPPDLRLVTPPARSFVTSARPVIELSFRDDGSGVDEASLELTANGAPLAVDCDFDLAGSRCTPLEDLPEGTVGLGARLSDLEGNAASTSTSFLVDTEDLEVLIVSPADRSVTGEDRVSVLGTVTSEVETVAVNGVPAVASGNSFSATVPLREGTNMVVAVATKTSGRTATGSIEITRDAVAPVVRITSPRDGFVSASPNLAITGLVNDLVSGPEPPRLRINGVPTPTANGSFLLEDLELLPGGNTIEVVAQDEVGNEGRHAVEVTFRPPVGPRLAIATGNGQASLVGQTLDEPLAVVVTDGQGRPLAGRPVRFEVSRNNGRLQRDPGDTSRRSLQVPTDGTGRAEVLFTLGDTSGEGNNRVRVTALGVAGEAEFCASGIGGEAEKILMVGGDNQRGLVGHPLAEPLEALVTDVHGNPLAGIDVTFRVTEGTGHLDGQTTRQVRTDARGIARAVLTLGNDPGINNNHVTATFTGLPGQVASFASSGLASGNPAETAFSGVVLDNGQTPIPGATVGLVGTDLTTTTGPDGQFSLAGVPVGHVTLEVDPSTSPRPEEFPALSFETVTVAGQDNILGQPILIPAVDTESSKIVGGAEDVTLTMAGVEGLALTVFAGSTTFPDGSPTGRLTISQVHLDKVPMEPPSGTLFMPPAWTIQPTGVTFDPPARIVIPNDGLPPGRVIDIFQFDHALNQFVDVAQGTVSEDGFEIVSDPGFGITRAGWGGCGQPQPPETCVDACGECLTCVDGNCDPEDQVACDDGRFCASFDGQAPGPGQCSGGECISEPIKDVEGAVEQVFEIGGGDFSDAIQTLSSVLDFVPVCDLEDASVALALKGKRVTTCCERLGSVIDSKEVTGQVGFGIVAECDIASFPLPDLIFELDIEGEITFAGELQASGRVIDCGGCSWKVAGGLTLTPALALEFELPGDLADATLQLAYGGQARSEIFCDKPAEVSGQIGPLTVSGSVMLAEIFSFQVSFEFPNTRFSF